MQNIQIWQINQVNVSTNILGAFSKYNRLMKPNNKISMSWSNEVASVLKFLFSLLMLPMINIITNNLYDKQYLRFFSYSMNWKTARFRCKNILKNSCKNSMNKKISCLKEESGIFCTSFKQINVDCPYLGFISIFRWFLLEWNVFTQKRNNNKFLQKRVRYAEFCGQKYFIQDATKRTDL